MSSFALTNEELAQFHKNGFIGPFKLCSPEEMHHFTRSIRRQLLDTSHAVYQHDDHQIGNTNITNYDRHLDIAELMQHIKRPEITDRLASILGPDILCWRTEFFPKYPGDEGTDWHQVKHFSAVGKHKQSQIEWPEDADFAGALSVWTAFTDATIENGCLQVVPGTHDVMFYDENKPAAYDPTRINHIKKAGEQRGFFGYDFRQMQKDDDWQPDQEKAVSLEMKAGEFIIFWSTLLHASHPHLGKTQHMRLGYTARYVPTSVKIYPNSTHLEEFGDKASLKNYRAVLVHGEDNFHHNHLANSCYALRNIRPDNTAKVINK